MCKSYYEANPARQCSWPQFYWHWCPLVLQPDFNTPSLTIFLCFSYVFLTFL